MLLDQETADLPRDAHLGRWFLASGVVGLVMALLLAVGLHYVSVYPCGALTFWDGTTYTIELSGLR